MTKLDLLSLIPIMIIAAAPVILVLLITIKRNLRIVYGYSLIMLIAAFVSLFIIVPYAPHNVGNLLIIDNYGILFLGIILASGILITVLSNEYLGNQFGEREEYFIMLFIALLGASILVVANHFVTFFLGLETLSISLYVLIAYLKWRDNCIEAGVKFLVIASVATAFLLFGMGLIYAETGTMSFQNLIRSEGMPVSFSPMFLAGAGLILTGVGFKLALVPFHMWTPDVYQGAPVTVTAFIATVSKGAVLALALRLFNDVGGYNNNTLFLVVSGISILSMFTGNLLALNQKNLKRLLAYSSIAHLGYLMITLLTGSASGIGAAIFYLAAYIITTLGAFGVISALSVCERDADALEDVKGLFWTNPWIAAVLSIALLSLAGLPLTAGFISKFYLVLAGVKSGLWILAFSLVVNSVISLYYYLRVVRAMFTPAEARTTIPVTLTNRFVLLLIAAIILFIGIMPSYLTELIGIYTGW